MKDTFKDDAAFVSALDKVKKWHTCTNLVPSE